MRTITLDQEMSFAEALQSLLDGKCLGIRPGTNSSYVISFKPNWMNPNSPDFMLKWSNTKGDSCIRTDQFMGSWRLVIVDHRFLSGEN